MTEDGADQPASSEHDQSQGALDAYLELSPDAVLAVDIGGRIRAANALAGELFGYVPEELIGLFLEELVPERYRNAHEAHRADYTRTPRTRRMGVGLDLWARRRDGIEFPVDISLAPLSTPEGLLTVAAIRDMTERRAEQAAQALLAAIVTSFEDAILTLDSQGVVTSWNPGAERLLGYEQREIVGSPYSVLVPDEFRAEWAEALKRTLGGDHVERFETRRRRRDGSEVEVEITFSSVRDRSGRQLGLAKVLRDLTERRRTEVELERAQHEHEQLLMMADRQRIARDLHDLVIQRIFAAGMALQASTGLVERPEVAQRIAAVIDELDATIREIRSTIFVLAHHPGASGLRAQLLDLAAEAVTSLGHEPTVAFEGPVDASVPEEVAEHLRAVLREALSNVARHARATATRIEVVVDHDVLLRVSDNGIGLGESTRVSGLSNLRQRAEELGGSLVLASSPGGGTQLEWRVPLASHPRSDSPRS